MVDTPANQAPVEDTALAHLYGRAGATTGQGFVKYPANQFAHAVGLSAADKGKTPYIDANGDFARLNPGSSTAVKYINSSGVPAWTAAGSDNQVMMIQSGVPTWSGNPSGVVFIQAQTASGSTSVDFTTGFSSIYDEYRFILIGVYPSTAAAQINMRISENAGSSFTATGYNTVWSGYINASTYGSGAGGSSYTEHGVTASAGPNNAAADAVTGEAGLFLTNTRANILSRVGWRHAATNTINLVHAWTMTTTASRANAVRFLASSGNINGKILMMGVKNA